MNDGIEKELCTLSYPSVDAAIRAIRKRGRGARLTKFDVESTYRLVPVHVHHDDRPLLGMKWRGRLYIDLALPFGLRSVPKIFTAIADAMQWMQHGVSSVLHYQDDFLLLGAPESEECEQALRMALDLCKRLGIPNAVHKTEGPATVIVFLGIELDTVRMEARLPEESRRACSKRELLSLIGQLQHACCVVQAGRSFL